MKIICDYCGSSIDTKQNSSCPFCGATYQNNPEYKEIAKRQDQLEELELEKAKIELESEKRKRDLEISGLTVVSKQNQKQKKTSPFAKGCLITIIVIAVVIIAFFALCAYLVKVAVDMDEKNPDIQQTEIQTTAEPEVEEVPVSGGFNETLSTSKYSVTITELKKADAHMAWKPNKGNMFIAVHFVVENITSEDIDPSETIICQADGFLMHPFKYSDDIYLSSNWLPAGMKTSGYQCFEVPIDSKEFTITYGDYITFTIENTIENTDQ